VSAADQAAPVSAALAKALFAPLARVPSLMLAVSGGPDSTALLVLAARWRAALTRGPELFAVTVDHALRRESAAEARAVAELARSLGVRHCTLRWRGAKPASGLQQAARRERYRLIAQAARAMNVRHVLTAHTLDDQAETVLIRMARGSGLTGLGAMAPVAPFPAFSAADLFLVRPFLDIPKARLVATLARAKISFAEDPSNRDPRFTRPRLRGVMPVLASEGLDAARLAILARRLRRAEAAIEMAVDAAAKALADGPWAGPGPIVFEAGKFIRLPAEVALRLLGRAVAHTGDEGPVELGKLEALFEDLRRAFPPGKGPALRRTLAGAMVTLGRDQLTVERAPARRRLTTGGLRRRKPSKRR
jgi:tRNA(Ile)-lysidine synthase